MNDNLNCVSCASQRIKYWPQVDQRGGEPWKCTFWNHQHVGSVDFFFFYFFLLFLGALLRHMEDPRLGV